MLQMGELLTLFPLPLREGGELVRRVGSYGIASVSRSPRQRETQAMILPASISPSDRQRSRWSGSPARTRISARSALPDAARRSDGNTGSF